MYKCVLYFRGKVPRTVGSSIINQEFGLAIPAENVSDISLSRVGSGFTNRRNIVTIGFRPHLGTPNPGGGSGNEAGREIFVALDCGEEGIGATSEYRKAQGVVDSITSVLMDGEGFIVVADDINDTYIDNQIVEISNMKLGGL